MKRINRMIEKVFSKKNMKQAMMGSISILLCLLITPFVTIALGLVEYSRVQQVRELTDELYELTGVSILSDYDTYINNRFGMLSVNQSNGFALGASDLLTDNLNALGKQAAVSDTKITGKLALDNDEILKQQLTDFSELTVPTAFVMEGLNLDDLLKKLEGVQKFNEIMNAVDNMAKFTDAMSDAYDAFTTLQEKLDTLSSDYQTAKNTAGELAQKTTDLYKKLGENGITLPENPTLEEIESAAGSFASDYLTDFKDLYKKGKELSDDITTLKTDLNNVKDAFDDIKTAVNKAKTAMESIANSTGSTGKSGKITKEATETLDDVLEDMEEAIDEAVSQLKSDTIETAKSALNEIINESLKSAGLKDISTRYNEIVKGSYFNLPLTDTAKEDIKELLQTVKEVYSSHDAEGMLTFFKNKFVPNLKNIDVGQLKNIVKTVVDNAEATMKDKATDGLLTLLTKLVNIIKNLFNLQLFFDPSLNAFVTIEEPAGSPYSDFLNALGGLFTAIDNFKDALSGLRFLKMLKELATMCKKMWDMLKAVANITVSRIESILALVDDVLNGRWKNVYQRALASGYMVYNLPNRTNDANQMEYNKTNKSVMLSLTGEGVTGFKYNNIARPAVVTGQNGNITAPEGKTIFEELGEFMNNLKAGGGSDKMFKGAELEYIMAGTNSELANQTVTFFDLYFLRLLVDIPSVFGDGEVDAIAGAANIACWVVYILYIIAEPFCDTVLLVNKQDVPLIKTKCWLTATNAVNFISKLGEAVLANSPLKADLEEFTGEYSTGEGEKIDGGIDYKTHILLLLMINVEPNTQIARLSDLIDLETKEYYRQNGKIFSMSKAYTAVQVSGTVKYKFFFDLNSKGSGPSIIPTAKITNTFSY